jgi:nitrate reductase NapE component
LAEGKDMDDEVAEKFRKDDWVGAASQIGMDSARTAAGWLETKLHPPDRVTCPYCGERSPSFKSRYSLTTFLFLIFVGLLLWPVLLVAIAYWFWPHGAKCPKCGTKIN